MRKLLASAVLTAYAFSIMPISPAKAESNDVLQFKLEVESAKLRDVYQSNGMAIGVYDPYGKNFKIFRYWIAVGTPKVDRLTNSDCTKPVFAWLKGKHPVMKTSTQSNLKNCKIDSRYGDVMACQNDKGQVVYYDVNDNSKVDITPLQGAFCRQVVGPTYLSDFMHISGVDVSDAGNIPSYDGTSSIKNYVIRNISYDNAMDLLAKYAFRNKLPFAIMVIHTFDVYTTKSKSLLKTKITYHFIEKPQYYILMAGVSAGTPFRYGYNILDGQAVGNNLSRLNQEILTKSKSGWNGFAMVLFQVALVALTYGAFSAGLPALAGIGYETASTVANVVSIGMGAGFAVQDYKSGVFNNLFDGMYSTQNLLKDGVVGGGSFGAGDLIMNDGYEKNTDITTGDGADQITQRTIQGYDGYNTLSGFNEATREKNAYWNWSKPSGGFIPNDKY